MKVWVAISSVFGFGETGVAHRILILFNILQMPDPLLEAAMEP